ncbi:FAD-dependent oxidoreductase [Cyanobium sp. Morenito 9A2]|uniref:FAD-dependent oxidoreductase n=1 Tax=Cyanobium sp. Morenito 9A2 TaxID=2823718 RepID=UPI0020CF096F|nr:FAD-dependent oxidoreductase [Cyanobium sp. Morenito 9A2]MCP9850573.1 FAD-dependent oxidoreductase [Cyanobium sp. Morenito 9A2]
MAISTERAAVVVWGGGSGGVAAALQAARSGADTLLLTPGPWLGGMVSAAGVCAPDGNELSPWQTGLWGALLRALRLEEPEGLDHNWVSCFGYRPASAERVLRRWLAAEARLRWWPNCTLLAAHRRGARLTALELETPAGPRRVALEVAVDGSDRGELLPLAQAPFRLGWESHEQWQEPSAPSRARLESDPFFRQQPVQSPTWVVMGQLGEGGAPIKGSGLASPFEQATASFGLGRTLTYGRLPGGLVMLNWPLHGNDWHRDLDRAFSGDPGQEEELAQAMRQHSLHFLSTLEQATDGWLKPGHAFPGLTPPASAAEGPEGDQSLALMPYWREGRRLVARSLVREQDLLPQGPGASIAPLPFDDKRQVQAIAVGNYVNDHHYPGPDWPLAPKACPWGGRWSGTPFTIPYGALISADVENLLAADKAIGTSHMANGATRLQPLVLNVGQAAGLAAALCVHQGIRPADLPVRELQEQLISEAQAPAGPLPLWDTPWHHPDWRERQRSALLDPSVLGSDGLWPNAPESPNHQIPAEPGEAHWSGTLHPDGQGRYQLTTATDQWPVITLEPQLHRWLNQLERPTEVVLIGTANPWGPWLRVSRLAR